MQGNVQQTKLKQDVVLCLSPCGSQDTLLNVDNSKISFKIFYFSVKF